MKNPKDKYFVGVIINGVEILEQDLEKSTKKARYWKYACPGCGAIKSARSDRLGALCISCGAKQRRAKVQNTVRDSLIGKEFGYLKVIGKSEKSNYWICECQKCGTVKEVFRGNLTQGVSKSCGCINSWGEEIIAYVLNNQDIKYQKEYTFSDLYSDKNRPLRFDFAIFNQDNKLICLIEYDGRQHYEYQENWKHSIEDFNRLQQLDMIKNEYCLNKNILLYRFNKKSIIDFEQFIYNLKEKYKL